MNLLRSLFPEHCPLCDGVRPLGAEAFCPECLKNLKLIRPPACMGCGRPVTVTQEYCPECEGKKRNYDGGRFSFSYDQIAGSIYRFKYMKRPAYARGYARVLCKEQKEWFDAINADALIPVPLHDKRLMTRGYNQSKVLAGEISRLTGIPVRDKCVARIKNTKPQKQFDRNERLINLKNAFIVRENVVELKTVIIVDDIFTTGSTIDSLAAELKRNGVERVFFLSLSAAGT